MTAPFVVAAAAWEVRRCASLADWQLGVEARLRQAARAGARLAVVPEYASLELCALAEGLDLAGQLDAVQAWRGAYAATYAALARELDLYVLAGSFPERDPDGRLRNRARLFGPGGGAGAATKQQLTRFETRWRLAPGDGATVFTTDLGTLGVTICYDAEFPLLARRQVEAGATALLTPSCTDALAGWWRVRVAAQARALENQCYVVHAPTVGEAPWCAAVDANRGAAAVYGPPDLGFPDDGVVALGALDAPGWTVATIDPAAVAAVRADGHVPGHRDWAQPRHLAGPVERVAVT